MLLNLSNHPAETWSPQQMEYAKQHFGGVQDMPFPAIPAGASIDEVLILADTYLAKIKAIDGLKAVHLMGEMSFTYALVKQLQQAGISCMVSTSDRNSVDNGDGTKTLRFEFVQFRAYPEL